jgi:hypothetical protein
LLRERHVADRKDLIDLHDVRVCLHHDRERELDHHARRVVLEPALGEVLELSAIEYGVDPAPRLALCETHQGP